MSVQDIWLDYRDAHNQMAHVTGYPTEKNISLLRRIVAASSNAGDLVLDCFAGAGTSLVAADMLGRRWVGVDNSPEAVRTMLHRFRHGTAPMGDFVDQVAKRSANHPSLFGDDAAATPPERPPGRPHMIPGFTLYASRDCPPIAEVP